MLLRAVPILTLVAMLGPILAGLAGVVLPAFGYLPALGGDEPGLGPFKALFASPGILDASLLSLATGLVSALAALLLVSALLAAWGGSRFFKFIEQLVAPMLSIPHAAAALGLAFLLAPSGWMVRFVSPHLTGWQSPPDWLIPHDPFGFAMMAGLAIKEMPFLLLVSLAALSQLKADRSLQAARIMGYGPMAAFCLGLWPQLYAQIRLPVFAVIAYGTSVVDVALILGPTTPPTLAVQLMRWMQDPDLSMRFAASAGAMLQLGVTLAAIGLWVGFEKAAGRLTRRLARQGWRLRRDDWLRLLTGLALGTVIATLLLALLGLAVWSFAGLWRFPDALPAQFTFANWARQAPHLATPLFNALAIGALSTLVALLLSIGCLEYETRARLTTGKGSLTLLYLPLIIPQIAFLFGLQWFFVWSGAGYSLAMVSFAHLVFVLPYVFLSLSDPWRALDPRYAQSAAALGKGPWTVFFKLRLPLLLRAILTASAVGFAVSIGQYLPTILIGGGRWETITTEAVALSAGGNRRLIGMYALLQMLLPFAAFALAALLPAWHRRPARTLTRKETWSMPNP